MKKVFFILCILVAVALAVLTLLLGCSQDVTVSEVFNAFAAADDTAPVLLGAFSESSSTVRLDFSEPVKLYGHYVGAVFCTIGRKEHLHSPSFHT